MTKQLTIKIIPLIIIAVIITGGSFYAGMSYGQNKVATTNRGGGFANLSPADRQARMANGGFAGGQRGTMRTGGGGITAGEILSKDDKSVTVKLNDGGSKIVFISDTTPIVKTVEGSSADLIVGKQITALGATNTDGSISAQSIQIRTNDPRQAR